MITILARHDLLKRAEGMVFEAIQMADFPQGVNEEKSNVIVFIESSDEVSGKFNYKELKNRFGNPYMRQLISDHKLGEYLAEITTNDVN